MRSNDMHRSLANLFREVMHGVPEGTEAFTLNPGDAGFLNSLDQLTAADASQSSQGGATIAAHANHVRYGFSLLNRWANGERNPFATADWTEAWRMTSVSDKQWSDLRSALRDQTEQWHRALQSDREINGIELDAVIGSIIHAGYHLGAIRQIVKETRGPKATVSA
jgi:hypothetical protein